MELSVPGIEPAAAALIEEGNLAVVAALSLAISVKRIADTMAIGAITSAMPSTALAPEVITAIVEGDSEPLLALKQDEETRRAEKAETSTKAAADFEAQMAEANSRMSTLMASMMSSGSDASRRV